ncbi:hypothetical protein BXA16_08220 [Salmonella enterica subsp. enterica serovar Typhimurium]|nr:hypothetical protein BXA16_08220 [Salmonella enterica subsp. enterica serovar Typhimurium]
MVDNIEQQVYELVRPYAGTYLFNIKQVELTPETYFPNHPFSWHPFKKTEPVPVPDFTISMLIESAKAGKWLYD